MIIHIFVLNFKCISGPTICGIKATGSSKCDCSDRFGLQVMKIFWEDFVEWFYMLTHPNSTHHITFLDIKICNLKYLFLKQWLQKKGKLNLTFIMNLCCHVTLQTFLLSDTVLHPTPTAWNWHPECLCSVMSWLLPWKWDWGVKRLVHTWDIFLQRFTSALQRGP